MLDLQIKLRLAVQRGLLGNTPANLAGLRSEISDRKITIFAFYFRNPSERDQECLSDAEGEIIGVFPDNYMIETRHALIIETRLNLYSWDFLRSEVYDEQ